MTTVIGIKGIDPVTREIYNLIISDTRGTPKDGTQPVDNDEKIFSPDNSNYVIGMAGGLFDLDYLRNNTPREVHIPLEMGHKLSKSELEDILINIDYYTKDKKETAEYIVSMQDFERSELLKYASNKFEPTNAYEVIGTGKEFTEDLSELDEFEENGFIVLEKQKAIDIGVKALENASNNDKYTGGFIDIAIIENQGIKVKRNYKRLTKENTLNNNYSQPNITSHLFPPGHPELDDLM